MGLFTYICIASLFIIAVCISAAPKEDDYDD